MLSIQQALETAVRHHQAGDLEHAEQLYRQVLQAQPAQADALNLLGVICHVTGRRDEALDCLRQAVRIMPNLPEAHYNLGVALLDHGKSSEAMVCFQQAVRLKPAYADAQFNLGNTLRDAGRLEEASACFQQAVRVQPVYARAQHNLGNVLLDLGKLDEAVECFRAATRLDPNDALGHSNLGNALREQGHLDESVAHCREAVRLDPNLAEGHHNLGTVLQVQGKLEEAIAAFERAIALRLGYPDAHLNRAMAWRQQGKMEEALAECERPLAAQPEYAEAHMNRAMLWLAQGDFERGWPEYEWRWRVPRIVARKFPQPPWQGEPLQGRTILLHWEQGLGDTIMFVRYAMLIKERGARTVVECLRPLFPLLSRCPGIDQLVAYGEPLPRFDYHAPLMSLPALLGTTLSTVPAQVPYVFPDQDLEERWRRELARVPAFKVGINWRGRAEHMGERYRAIPLAHFEPLARLPGLRLFSVQKGSPLAETELREQAVRFPVTDLGSTLDQESGPFMDTAAVMRNLDLVITSDTATAHLAGALGVPVWVALPHVPEWRWLLEREDSPWYPTMRLFRQKQPGDWAEVFERITAALRQRLQGSGQGLVIPVTIAPGELINKITILELKAERLTEAARLRTVRAELAALVAARDRVVPASDELARLAAELRAVNERLWQIEDDLRLCERNADFGPRFVALARSVYQQHERRAALKRQVNELFGSALFEEKAFTVQG